MIRMLVLGWVCVLCASMSVSAADNPPCQIQVILFTPADVAPPTGYQVRVDEIVHYAEAFFTREFQRWGHKTSVQPFRRGADGHVEVTELRGQKKTADYKPVDIRVEVMDHNRRRDKLSGGRQVWWILVYSGAPPKADVFLGGFGQEIGGWAVSDLDTTPGPIDPRAELGSDVLVALKLKGMLHELGHGLRLPHIGPLRGDNAGNTLMGPTHANFRRVVPQREERVYLSEAEAALLSMNPVFRGCPTSSGRFPEARCRT